MLIPHYEIRLSVTEQQALAALQRAGKTPQQTVRRVTILLLAHEGLSNQAIADQVGTSRNLVQKWRKSSAERGLEPKGGLRLCWRSVPSKDFPTGWRLALSCRAGRSPCKARVKRESNRYTRA
jgi:hypothetical protein